MKRFYLFLLALAISSLSFATPVDKYIPGDYATVALAVTALNTNAFSATGVTFHIAAGYTESITANIMITATGTSTTPIVFIGDGTTHAVITRTDAGTLATSTLGGQGDAVILIEGGDYITFRFVDVATTQSTIEYGYYLRKLSATDACKNVSIRNCVVDMTKGTSGYVTGIYVSNNVLASTVSSATGVTVTAVGGISENILIRGNTIQDVHVGVILRGYSTAAYFDMNNEVGTTDNGNTIQNFGGGNTGTSYGVYMIYQANVNVNNNTINNTANGGSAFTGTAYGIFHSTAANGNGNYNDNTITLSSTTGQLRAINFGTAGTAVHNVNNNVINMSMAGTSEVSGIYLSGAVSAVTINNNTFSYGTNASTTTSYLIYASSTTPSVTISGNHTSGTLVKAGGGLYCYYNLGSPTSGTETFTNNNFSNITISSGSTALYGIYSNTAVGQSRICSNNTVSNLTHSGTGTIYGIYVLSGLTNQVNNNNVNTLSSGGGTIYGLGFSGTTPTVYENTIYNISTSGTILYGLYNAGTGTTNCYKNKIYNLTNSSTTGTLSGIYVSTGTFNKVYNNFVSDLNTPLSTSILITGLNGIYVAGGTKIGIYYNSVYMNANSSGATFGSAALGVSTTANLDLRNNILVNTSTPVGTGGITCAYRRSTTTLTSYYEKSNGNCFYVGPTEDATHAVYYDGALVYTLSAYKGLVIPRDANSLSTLPPFINVATAPYDLHINPATPNGCESGGFAIKDTVDNDYDLDIRWNSTGYPAQVNGGGTAVDIGADEFDGVPNYTCNIVNPEATIASTNPICLGKSVVLSMQSEPVGTGLTYQWQSSPNGTSSWTNVPGAVFATLTVSPIVPTWYKCVVSCVNGPNGESTPLQITFNGGITSHTNGLRCGTGTVDLEATGSGWGTLGWYLTPVGGGVALGNGTTFTTPSISSTTTYYVGEEVITPGTIAIGAGALTSSTYSNPFYSAYSNNHTQHIILASELIAAGIYGGNINSVALDVTNAYTLPMIDFALKIGTTSATDMSAFVSNAGFTTVYTNPSFMPTTGLNVLTFSPAFNWDGVSNIVLEFCHGNAGSTATMSRIVKFDNTSYISTIKAHFNAATAASVECANTTNLPVTYTGRPQFTFNAPTVCSSPRTAVTASVSSPLPLTVSADQTLCNNSKATLAVTSTLSNFDEYKWTPITDLFSDPACANPYNGNSDSTVYYKSTTAGVHTYVCTAKNFTSLCGNTDTIVIANLPSAVTISAAQTLFCLTGSTVLTASPATGYGSATLQWQDSPDGTTFTDISGANAITFTTPTLTSTKHYRLEIKLGANVCTQSNVVTVTVNSPLITSTTPATRCGIGTVTLSATASPVSSTVNWYTASTGGSAIATGNTYITPIINATTDYWVAASSAGGSTQISSNGVPTVFTSTQNGGLIFDLYVDVTLNSIQVFSNAVGTVTVTLQNSALTTLYTSPATPVVIGGLTTPQTIPLGWAIPAGTGYRILVSNTGNSLGYASGSFPAPMGNGVGNIVNGALNTGTSTLNYFVYNMNTTAGCFNTRTLITATVTPPPAFTVTANQTICNNTVSTLAVTSTLANYDSYIWSPSTHLYTDFACTLPYNGTSSASTVYFKSTTGGSYPYICTASQTSGNLCADTSATILINSPGTPVVTAAPSQICISGTSTISLTPATGWGAATFQWQDSPNGTTYTDIIGATGMNYTTPTLTSTTYYRLNISTVAGLCTQLPITLTVNNPQITGTTPGSRCGYGTVTLGASVTDGTLNWYDNSTGGTPIGTGTSFTTPIISNTTSYWVGAASGYAESYVGMAAPSTGATSGAGTTNFGLVFDALSAFTLKTVTVYPVSSTGATGSVTIDVINSSGTVLHTVTVNNITGSPAATPVPYVINCDFYIQPGTNLKMRPGFSGISGLLFEPTAAAPPSGVYPYPFVIPGIVSINTSTLTAAPTNTARNDLYYYFYNWKVAVGCTTPLQEVVATVTAPPTLTLSNNQSVCNNAVATIDVLSPLSNFDTYVWTPVTDLFTNLACTTPYTTGSSASTVYYKSATAGTHLYTCSATKTSSGCVNAVQTAITTLPATLTITATPAEICFSGSSYLQPTQLSGWGTANFQWQDSPNGTTYTDIPTGLNIDYTTPLLSGTTYYKLLVMNGSNICTSATKTVAVHNPQITSTTGATRCGIGTVQLTASGSGGTLHWYDSPSSGTIMGTGTSFITPVISSTTNYYVASEFGQPPTVVAVGAGATTSATYSNPFYSLWSNIHTQHIIPASELTAAGISAGNLTSVALDITVAGTLPMLDLSVKIGTTSASTMADFVPSGSFSTVFTSASYMPTVGLNTLTFSSPFYWDGASNIVLEFCHGNPASSATMSRTCKADNTSYVSSIKTNISAAASAATICGDITTGKTTYSVRPQFTFGNNPGCYSPRVPVEATVTPALSLTVSANQTICPNAAGTLSVTSTLSNFNTYTWTPGTNLFTDAGCTIPYTTQNLSTVYVKSANGGATVYTCNALNTGDGCANIAQTTVTVIPANPIITASPDQICVSGSALLSVSPATGYGSGSFQWQDSPTGTTYSDIIGQVNSTYTTPALSTQAYYQVQVKDGAGAVCMTPQRTMIINNPLLSNTYPASRCGVGTVQLGAAGSGGTLNWYASPTSGTILGSGSTFTTPIISASATYYVASEVAGSSVATVILGTGTTTTSTSGVTPFTSYYEGVHKQYLVRASELTTLGLNAGTINSLAFDVTASGPGTYPQLNYTIKMAKTANTEITGAYGTPSGSFTTVYTSASEPAPAVGWKTFTFATPFLWDGISNILIDICHENDPTGTCATCYSTSSTVAYTASSFNSVFSTYNDNLPACGISATNVLSSTYYTYRPNMKFNGTSGCSSPRVPVEATVTPPPALTVSTDQTICSNTTATLSVLSTLSDFDTYVWSPSSNLYTDFACALPYDGISSVTTLYFKSVTGSSQNYTCTATKISTGCVNVAQSVINNLPANATITTSGSICGIGSEVLSLSPATGWGIATFQWQTSANGISYTDINGATGVTYTTPTISSTTYYQVVIKIGGSTICSTPQYTVEINNPQLLSTTPSTQCGYGYATLGATGSGGTLNWFAAATGGNPIATGPTFHTPLILNTTSYYVECNSGGGLSGSVGPVTNSIGAGGTAALDYYEIFDVLSSSMTLQGVYVYPGAVGDVKLYIANSAGTELKTVTYAVTATGVKTYIPINFNITGGTGYRIGYKSASGGVSMYRNTAGAVYPYTLPGVVSITGNSFVGYPAYFYYCYDWRVTSACTSPRQEVIATVTPAPAITVSGTSPICDGQSTTLNVTGHPSYDLFMWLTTSDTIPGATQIKSPTTTTVYTAVAIASSTGCVNADVFPVVVYPAPTAVTVTPPSGYTGSITQLTASGGNASGNTSLFDGFETFPSANFAASDTNIKPTSNTTYYSAGSKSVHLAHNTDITASYSLQHDINMTGYSAAQLTFSHICGLEDAAIAYDLGYVEYSTNGGTSWTVFPASSYAGSGALITTQGSSTPVSGVIFSTRSYPAWIAQFTSPTSTPGAGPASSLWRNETINVPSAALTSSQFRVRFKIVADQLTVHYGWLIDNVNISGTSNVNYTWSPTTDLYTDAAATIPYTGGLTNTVYTNPTSAVIYTATTSNGYSCSSSGTASFEPLTKTLEAKVFLEGLYAGGGMMRQANGSSGPQFGSDTADVVTVEMHNATPPYARALEFTPVGLHTDGSLTLSSIPGNLTGSYYLVIIHRNSVETWSADPVDFSGVGPIIFDFSSAASQAYGGNQKNIGGIYAIWSGDVNQDGVVDGSDLAEVDNANSVILTGYFPQDVNGDGVVDGSDLALVDNNNASIIQVIKP